MRVVAELLGVRIDKTNMTEAVKPITSLIEGRGEPGMVITLNPEFLFRAQFDKELLDLANRAQLVTADGVGIVWACRMAGQPVPERVTGIDLMLKLVRRAAERGWRLFMLGAEPGVAEEAAERLRQQYPGLQVTGIHHGYFRPDEDAKIVDMVRKARADLLFVAMGAPKQEIWIDRYLNQLGVRAAVGVGGCFDVIAGRARRAPVWMQRLHVEWLGRLFMEPWRWRRMMVLPKFVWLVLRKYKFSE